MITFIVATLIHLGGASALFQESFRLLAEWKRTGVGRHPVWLTVMSWIWEPVPLLYQYACHAISKHFPSRGIVDLRDLYRGFVLLIWSICVGVIFGFLVPRLLRWRRQTI